jgi:hypothetical protein
MNTTKREFSASLRIVWTIAAKDVVDALRNKITISIIIGVAFLMLSGQALSLLLKLRSTPSVVVYDAGKSDLVAGLKKSDDLRLRTAPSQQELEQAVGEAASSLMGLTIPADFDQTLEIGDPVELNGYFVHWIKPSEAAEVQAFFEDKLAELTGQPVRVNIKDHKIYPSPDSGGQPFMVSMSLVTAILTICGAIVPFLMSLASQHRPGGDRQGPGGRLLRADGRWGGVCLQPCDGRPLGGCAPGGSLRFVIRRRGGLVAGQPVRQPGEHEPLVRRCSFGLVNAGVSG